MRIRRLHRAMSLFGLAGLLALWSATVVLEVWGRADPLVRLKIAVPWILLVLIPALALAGFSGARLAGGRTTGSVGVKLRRTRFIAANGLCVLLPAALYLADKAAVGELDGMFHAVQWVELCAGALNLVLLMLNARDGLRLKRRAGAARDASVLAFADREPAANLARPAGHR